MPDVGKTTLRALLQALAEEKFKWPNRQMNLNAG